MIETTLSPTEIERHARALRDARAAQHPVEPLTDTLPDLSVADAYAIARHNVELRHAAGARITGHKIGLTSPAVQAQLGVDQPDYGTLLDEMTIADGATVDTGLYIAPRVELELAFVLGASLTGPDITAEEVRRATAAVRPSLELVDSRVRDWRIRLADTIADAASSAGYVLGSAEVSLTELNSRQVAGELYRNGELVEEGHSSAVLGDPCLAIAWLANALAAVGETLEAGQVILSGACTRMVSVTPGDCYTGILHDVGEVSVNFAPKARA